MRRGLHCREATAVQRAGSGFPPGRWISTTGNFLETYMPDTSQRFRSVRLGGLMWNEEAFLSPHCQSPNGKKKKKKVQRKIALGKSCL